MSGYAVFVDVAPGEAAPFTYIPSPVKGGNLGVVVGIANGANLWMAGRGQDGVVTHEMVGETTYTVRGELLGSCENVVGPIVSTVEVQGRVTTRDVGPLKALVNMLESSFWAFGEEGEVRAAARGWCLADGEADAATAGASVGSAMCEFCLPPLADGVTLPPIKAPARECKDLYDVRHAAMKGGRPIAETRPFVVRSQAALEVLENGFPTGAHALGTIEARHNVDVRIELRPSGGDAPVFLRWTATGGFDEASRDHLSPSALREDDRYRERVARAADLRQLQERAFQSEIQKLRSMESGLGAEERQDAEIDAFMQEAAQRILSEKEIKEGGHAIRKAYEEKKVDGKRHRAVLAELARRFRDAWKALCPAELDALEADDWGEDEDEDAAPKPLDLTTPDAAYRTMIGALKDGDFDRFQMVHHEAVRPDLTRDGFQRAVKSLAQKGDPPVEGFQGNASSRRVVLKDGRTLTRLVNVEGRWMNRRIWTR